MNKSTKLGLAALALCLAGAAAPAAAADAGFETRAVSALGIAIASQGNAALLEIKRELKDTLVDQLKPFLPAPSPTPSDTATPAPARKPVRQ